jgi:enoyl-CoA hydratase/carnithine racemase
MAVLNMMDDLMAADYSAKAPATAPAAFLELMAAETWFTAEAALELGLIDSITEARPPAGGSTPTNLATVYAKAPAITAKEEGPAPDAVSLAAKASRDRFANYLKLGRV